MPKPLPILFAIVAAAVRLAAPEVQAAPSAKVSEAPIDRMTRLNNEAIEDIRGQHFKAARYRLEIALAISETADLDHDEVTAWTYVHLAVVHLTGFKDRDAALAQFLMALRIDPNVTITPGLETPALRLAYLEAREQLGLPPSPDSAMMAPSPDRSSSAVPQPALIASAAGANAVTSADGTPAPSAADDDPDPPAHLDVPLRCDVPVEAPHGKPPTIRCLTQKQPSRSTATLYIRGDGDGSSYSELPMQRKLKGWLAAVVPGEKMKGTRLTFYVKAQIPSLAEPIYNGHPEDPISIPIHEPAIPTPAEPLPRPQTATAARKASASMSVRRAPKTWWFALGLGTGVVYHGRRSVDSGSTVPNTELPVTVGSGFTHAGLLQLEPEVVYQLTRRFAVSLMGRYQIAPKDGAADVGQREIQTSALAGFVRGHLSFAERGRWLPHTSAGIGLGNSFLGTIDARWGSDGYLLKHSDTVHGGMVGLTAGVGIIYRIGPQVGIFADLNAIITVPKPMLLGELNFGAIYSYGQAGARAAAGKAAASEPGKP